MNERIKKLYDQALESKFDYGAGAKPGEYYSNYITVLNPEKFAELIVKECYEHCKGQVLDKEVADTNELTYNDAVSDCANGLLQHFGIEE